MASGNSICSTEGQKATEMIPPSTNTGHPLNARVQRPGTSGK